MFWNLRCLHNAQIQSESVVKDSPVFMAFVNVSAVIFGFLTLKLVLLWQCLLIVTYRKMERMDCFFYGQERFLRNLSYMNCPKTETIQRLKRSWIFKNYYYYFKESWDVVKCTSGCICWGFFKNEQFTISLIMHVDVSLKFRLETMFGLASQSDISVYKDDVWGFKNCLFQEDLSYLLATFGMSNSRNIECVTRSWVQMK